MGRLLWLMQCLLALTFLASGIAKSLTSKDRMIATGQTGVAPFPLPVIRAVAGLEIAGAVAMVLPWALQICPILTPLAALGFVLLMIGAGISHATLHEYRQVLGVNLILALIAGCVSVMRWSQL